MNENSPQPWLLKQPITPRSGAELRWAADALDLTKRAPVLMTICAALMYSLSGLVSLLARHQPLVQAYHTIIPASCALVGPFLICTCVLIRIADLGGKNAQWNLAFRNALKLWIDLIFLPASLTIVLIFPLAFITVRGGNDPFTYPDLLRFLALSIAVSPLLAGLFHFQCSVFETGTLITLRLRARKAVKLLKMQTLMTLLFAPASVAVLTPAIGGGFLIVIGTIFGQVYQYCAWREVFGRTSEGASLPSEGNQP